LLFYEAVVPEMREHLGFIGCVIFDPRWSLFLVAMPAIDDPVREGPETVLDECVEGLLTGSLVARFAF